MPVIETRPASPWHRGEIAIQKSLGVAERMEVVGRGAIRDHIIEQHRAFYPLLPFALLGTVDHAGDVWATIRSGRPGFLHAPDASHLNVETRRETADPADEGMGDGDAIALLGIELTTRRRNRLNGTVRREGSDGFAIEVEQSYGNCPQYIQLRPATFTRDPHVASATPPAVSRALDDRARAIVAAADTFFVATYVDREERTRQVDVSHRGGRPGFVRIGKDGVLTIPDFAGNQFFNTLGNIAANPRAGLVFVDFATGNLLQMTGSAEVVLNSPEIAAFQGAERLWRFAPKTIVFRAAALPLRFSLSRDGWSPNALMTGTWTDAADRLAAATKADAWRPFRIARIVDESEGIRSFHLKPADCAGIILHKAGQHLPIRVKSEGSSASAIRIYTLSTAPSDGLYRLSVKAEGQVSRHLHGLDTGDVVEARAPAGAFTIDAAEQRPAVLIAAGIGITPILAMLRHVVYEGLRTRRIRPTWLFYAARSLAERAFDTEIDRLVDAAGGAVRLVRVLSDGAGAIEGRDYDRVGRIEMAMLGAALPFGDYDFYLCGPPGFMQAIYDGLRGLNVVDDRIHAEAFGPGSLKRSNVLKSAAPRNLASTAPVTVLFAQSGKEANWTPGSGSLLELAEAHGLRPDFTCRSGVCGSCCTRVAKGDIAYTTEPSAEIGKGEALICCSVPARREDGAGECLVLDL